MADRMAVLRDGVIEQVGRPRDVYRRPSSRFVADFIGEANWIPGIVRSRDASTILLETPAGLLVGTAAASTATPGTAVDVGFRPEAVRLRPEGQDNLIEAEIEQVTYLGETEQYRLKGPGETRFKAFEQNPESLRAVGARLRCQVAPADLFVIPTLAITNPAPPRAGSSPSE